MINYNRFILFLILISPFIVVGQSTIKFDDLKPIYQKMDQFYNKSEFKMEIIISSYKGHHSTVAKDNSKGYVFKKGGVIESYQVGVYSIQDKEKKIIIDSSEMVIGITYPDTVFNVGYNAKHFEAIQNFITNITSKSIGKSNLITIYYKEGTPYDKVTLKVNSATNFIEEFILYQSDNIEYENQEGEMKHEKAKIKFSFRDLSKQQNKFHFKIAEIISYTGKKYSTTAAFKRFELIDFRYAH